MYSIKKSSTADVRIGY